MTDPAKLALEFARDAGMIGHEVVLAGFLRGAPIPATTPLGEACEEFEATFRLVVQRFRLDPGALGQMGAIIRRFKPQVVQSHGLTGSFLARPALRRGIPWQAIVNATPIFERSRSPGAFVRNRFARAMYRRAEQVIADTPEAARELKDRGVEAERILEIAGAENRTGLILEAASKLARR